eukprot:IDg11725t1
MRAGIFSSTIALSITGDEVKLLNYLDSLPISSSSSPPRRNEISISCKITHQSMIRAHDNGPFWIDPIRKVVHVPLAALTVD